MNEEKETSQPKRDLKAELIEIPMVFVERIHQAWDKYYHRMEKDGGEEVLCEQAKRDLEMELMEIRTMFVQQVHDAWESYHLRVKKIREEMEGRRDE